MNIEIIPFLPMDIIIGGEMIDMQNIANYHVSKLLHQSELMIDVNYM
jgi:hypothetical protein